MPEINILDRETFSKIAAGEVVERPASVVKELLENSLDAGAREITVEIENGGLDLLKIIDDGKGILNDDMRSAFMPHATSKIKAIEDIFSIETLGFRGEALASIASVAKVLLKSRNQMDQDGMEIYIEGGEEKFLKYSPISRGTQVEVRELFFNVPARLKFLKTVQKEASTIADVMLRLALSRPDVAFTYVNTGKVMVRSYGTGNLIDVIRSVYSRKTAENVTHFSQDFDGYRIHGYLGNEELARGSRNQQTLFVNGRYVKSMSITAAVEQAYRSFITVSKYPFFVLNIEVDPQTVDVNVHPQKAEVKFSDDRLMFKSVFDTIHMTLREIYSKDLGFQERLEEGFPVEEAEQRTFEKMDISDRRSLEYFSSRVNEDRKEFYNVRNSSGNHAAHGSGDRISEDMAGDFKESGIETERETRTEAFQKVLEVDLPIDLSTLKTEFPEERSKDEVDTEDKGESGRISRGKEEYDPVSSDSYLKFPMPRVIGQFDRTYILCELGDTLYLFDQHAAHEKINFERYMDELEKGEIVIQPLLSPHMMELSLDDYSICMDNMEVFNKAGFSMEDFGDRSITIREVPYFLGRTDVERYFHDIIDNLRNLGKGTPKEVRYLKIATAACKASVRARDELRYEEMVSLIEELRTLKEPFTCPHGRPTMIRLTRTDLEKMFRRIQ